MEIVITAQQGSQTKSRSYEFLVSSKGSLQPKLTFDDQLPCFSNDTPSKLEFNYNIIMPFEAVNLVSLIINDLPAGVTVDNADLKDNHSFVIQNASLTQNFTLSGRSQRQPLRSMER